MTPSSTPPVRLRGLIGFAIALFSAQAALAASDCVERSPLRFAAPAAEDVSVDKLFELTEWIENSSKRILSLTMSRNGAVIYELYSSRIDRDAAHYLMSITKSATSAVAGAAVTQGALAGADQTISGVLPRRYFDDETYARFKQVTLRDAMGMSALDAQVPPHLISDETRKRQADFLRAPNRLQFALTQKLLPHVGGDFQYTDITPYLVGGAVQYATGMSLFDYATKYLFGPMDFRNAEWMHTDPTGINNPSYGLRLRPIDMQKFGLLYLNEGCWKNKQLLSRDWVRQSFVPWIKSRPGYAKPNYGWFWWTRWRNTGWNELQANGWKGQRISVFPDKQIVVTMTAIIDDGSEDATYERIINGFIIPSVELAAAAHGKSEIDLKAALSKVRETKNALLAPIEDRMIPSSRSKETPPKFRP